MVGMLPRDFLLRTTNIIGSREEIYDLLGISKQRFNAWLNGEVVMGFEFAIVLAYLTCEEVTVHDLVPKKAQLLEKFNINISNKIPWMTRQLIPITNIKIQEPLNEQCDDIESLAEDIKKQGLLHPIAIDPKHSLIVGKQRLQACKLLNMNSISALILSLKGLLKDEEAGYQLKKYFSWSERVAVGIALDNFIGKRQGKRTDLSLRLNLDEVKGRTDQFIAQLLNLGNKDSYRKAKKIIQTNMRPLIRALDEEKISISTAFELMTLSPEEQQQILLGGFQSILKKIKQLKNKKRFVDSVN